MNAIRLREPKQFELIELPEPSEPGSGEALVRVHRMGICGTDISGYLGKMPLFSYPRVIGHELGVEVLAVGEGVTNVTPGQHCSVEPYMHCGQCFACRRGGQNCCENLRVLGVHIDGGLRPRFVLPAEKLHTSAKLTWEQLALVETLAIGCHAVNRASPCTTDHALVIGAGPIGLSVIEFLKLAGSVITVLDMSESRLDFCRRTMGVAHTVRAGEGAIRELTEITSGSMFPVVMDATGSVRAMCEAFQYVAHTGHLVFVGIVPEEIRFSDPLFHRREMTVMASRNALPSDFTWIIDMIETGQIDTRPWITHRTSFDAVIEAFPSYTKPETGVIKAMIDLTA